MTSLLLHAAAGAVARGDLLRDRALQASWVHFTMQLFDRPAGGSMAQDAIIVLDGRRRGMRHAWLYFVVSLFTSSWLWSAFRRLTVTLARTE